MPRVTSRSLYRVFLGAALASLFVVMVQACSYLWAVKLDIEIAEGVEIPANGRLVIVQGYYPPRSDAPAEPADAPWGHSATKTLTLVSDRRSYAYEGATCCSPVETTYSYVYIDLDLDGTYDAGEPYGADPGNPVKVEADYSAKITVRNPR
jgi:hypothetical protein